MFKALIADGLHPEGLAKLKAIRSLEVLDKTGAERAELKKLLPQVDILVVRSRTEVDDDLFSAATQLKLVIRAGIGLDNIDVNAATDRGVIVMNAPTGNIVTTAEHAIGLMFAVSRHIPQADASLRAGKWEKKMFQGNELREKTLGVVGLGNIGRTVAEKALGLGMKVVAFDPFVTEKKAAELKVRLLPLDGLLKESDYVSLHVPLIESTRHLIGKEAFKKIKKGAYLIHCARGGIVDEAAMIEALDSGVLSGAALDVFEVEPPPKDSPLLKRTDVVLTPHLGASTDEAQYQVSLEVAEEITQFVENGALKNAVNVPNISLEQLAVIKPYLKLCERLGSFSAQIPGPKNPKKILVKYEGGIAEANRPLLTLSVLKGFLTPFLSTSVNYVNVRKNLKERGIEVQEAYQDECADYSTLVSITIEGEQSLTVSGTIFGREEPRIVRIDRFAIDAIPEGSLLFTRNTDQPGVIGSMGTILAERGVNIAGMHLGRDHERGEAIAVIACDSAPSRETLQALRAVKGMLVATAIAF